MVHVRVITSPRNKAVMSAVTHVKHAEETEHEMHQIAYNAGINVPRVVSWDSQEGLLTTEMVPGVDVIEYLRPNHLLGDTITVCTHLVRQLQKLHALGHTHGDLNPTNVIITPNSEVFLLDFEFTGSGVVDVDEEIMDLIKLLTILLAPFPMHVFRLVSLCEATGSSRLPFALRDDVMYDEIITAISHDSRR